MATANINTGVNSHSFVKRDKFGRRVYKNRINAAMAEYREDFRYNRDWWTREMGSGRNNEYLWIQYKNGDSVTINSDYFEQHSSLPRFRADEVDYICRYFGDGIEVTTTANMEIDTDRITLYCDGVEFFRVEMTAEQYAEMREALNAAIDAEEDPTKAVIEFCLNLAQNTIAAEKRTAIESAKATANFEELTLAGSNIVLTAKNDGDIYRRYVEPLLDSLANKVAKGVQLNASTLASCVTVANIISESIRGLKSSGWSDPITAGDRRQAAAYLASCYISDAIENAKYINA